MSTSIAWSMLCFAFVLWAVAGLFMLATRAYMAVTQPVLIKPIDRRRQAEVRLGAHYPNEQ